MPDYYRASIGTDFKDWRRKHKPKKNVAKVAPDPAADTKIAPLVLVPGLCGSRLVNAKNSVRWLAIHELCDCCSLVYGPLFLPLAWETDPEERQESDGLVPDSILQEMSCCGLVAKNVYGEFMEHFEERLGRVVVPFSYDFRRDLGESFQ